MGIANDKRNEAATQALDKLQRAGCIIGFAADAFMKQDDPVTGETLQAACDLIYQAIEEMELGRSRT